MPDADGPNALEGVAREARITRDGILLDGVLIPTRISSNITIEGYEPAVPDDSVVQVVNVGLWVKKVVVDPDALEYGTIRHVDDPGF